MEIAVDDGAVVCVRSICLCCIDDGSGLVLSVLSVLSVLLLCCCVAGGDPGVVFCFGPFCLSKRK